MAVFEPLAPFQVVESQRLVAFGLRLQLDRQLCRCVLLLLMLSPHLERLGRVDEQRSQVEIHVW